MASADSKRAMKLSSGKSQTNNAQPSKNPVKKSSSEPVSAKVQSGKSTKVSSTANNGAKSGAAQKASGERQELAKNVQNVRNPPQPYKQRHNIGRRVAAERIGTYNEVELAECYSGVGSARWLSGNAELGFKPDVTKQGSDDIDNDSKAVGKSESKKKNRSDSQNLDQLVETEKRTEVASKSKCLPVEKTKKASSSEEVVPELASSSKLSPVKGKMPTNALKKGSGTACNTATSSSAMDAVHQDQNAVAVDSSSIKPVLKDFSELKEGQSNEGSELKPSDIKDGCSLGLAPKKQLKLTSHTSPGQMSKASPGKNAEKSATKKSVSKSSVKTKCSLSKGVIYDSEPEAPRSKRMARLNAEAIMSLMCERDEAVPAKKARLDYSEISSESESNVSSDSSDEDESAEAFRRQLSGKKSLRNKPVDVTCKESISEERDVQASSKSSSGDVKSKGRSKIDSKCKVLGKSKSEQNNQLQESELKAARKEKKIRDEVNLNVSSPSPPPKRMASLNAQAILAASKDDKVKKAKYAGDLLNLSVLKAEDKSPVSCPHPGTGDNSKASESQSVAQKGTSTQSPSDSSRTGSAAEKQQANASHATSCSNTDTVVFTEGSSSVSDVLTTSAPLSLTSSSSAVTAPVPASQASTSHSSNAVSGQGRSLSKARTKQNQSHSRTGSEHGTSRSQPSADWSKQANDGRTSANSSDAPGSNFCQPTIAAPPSQAIGFPVATRLTATVAPSPVRFNVPVIVPQPSVAGYLAAAARPSHHAYYPYAAGQNVFAYPVAGYPSTAHSYGSSTVASWSGLQDISQFSYQPALAAASLCSTGAGRGTGVLPQQQLPLQSPQQASQFFRPCFQPLAQAHQTQQYPNLQPAHSSLALYPARLGVVASTDAVLPSTKVPETSSAKGYDSRALAGIPGAGVLPVQPSTVPPNQFSSAVTSSPSSKSKRPSSSVSSNAGFRNDASSVTSASTHCHRDVGNVQSARETSSCAGNESPLVKSYYVLGNDRRSGTVVTESAVVTASTIIQPFGIYAGCVSAPFNVAGLSPGQTSQAMPLGCFQPAGPLIPVPAFWDMQGFGQVPHLVPAVKQTSADAAIAEKGMAATVLPDKPRGDTCTQTVGRSAASSSASKGSGKKSRSRLQVDPVITGGASVTPKKLETAVVTGIQMSAVSQYVDQERELDLSQKSSTVCSTSSLAGINNAFSDVSTQNKLESRQQQIGDQSAGARVSTEGTAKTSSSSTFSQIRNLERFVSGMVADNVHPTSTAESSSDFRPVQSHLAKKPSKRKLDMSPDCSVPSNTDLTHGQSVKRAKHMNFCSAESGKRVTQSPPSKPMPGSSNNVEQQCRGLNILVPNESSQPETKSSDTLLIDASAVTRPCRGEPSETVSTETVSSPDVKLKNDIHQTRDEEESLTVSDVSFKRQDENEMPVNLAYSCSDSSSSSPKLIIDETDKTSPLKPTDGFFMNTPEVCSPVKNDSATISKTKSGAGSDSGKKRRKEVMGSSMRDRKIVTGEVIADDKSQKSRSMEDSVKKASKTGLWQWYGDGEMKLVHSKVDMPSVARMCYPAVRHADGDIIRVRDCVLVKSGMRKKDIPYVAKIDKFWEEPESGEMFMSILWYYRLEHTGTEPLPRYIDCEVFASRHRDVIPVACIEDRCYVLTLGEYNRYKAELRRRQSGCLPRAQVVPQLLSVTPDSSSKEMSVRKLHRHGVSSRLPDYTVDQETIFLCRQVYDIKLRRILKNPPIHVSVS